MIGHLVVYFGCLLKHTSLPINDKLNIMKQYLLLAFPKSGWKLNKILFLIYQQIQMSKIIENYIIQEKVGSGQYGNVFRGQNINTN